MAEWVFWVPLLPALAAFWIGLGLLAGWNRGERGERATARVASWAVGASLGVILGLDLHALLSGTVPGSIRLLPWIDTTGFRVMISFTLDRLALSMTTLAALLAWLTIRFSVNYLHREAGFHRFFACLTLFISGLLLFLTAGNGVLAFVGWELMGLTSYLLIGYAVDRPTATRNATRVFVTNRLGDAGFTVAMLLAYTWLGSSEWTDILGGFSLLSSMQFGILSGGFLLAALVKSSQFPFAAWIGRALEGPTPSSAIFYGSLMVHAGVYLLLRLEGLIGRSPFLMVVLILLGALTAVYGLLVGLVQTDVKSALICATQTQVGLMFLACGLGWFEWAAWHMALHASWRAYQFLSAPSYMHFLDGPTAPVWAGLHGQQRLFAAAQARFWLDPLADLLITRPSQSLARDVQSLEDRLFNRLLGSNAMERILFGRAISSGESIPGGVGLPGGGLAYLANRLSGLEERIVGLGGEGMLTTVAGLGRTLMRIDRLFSEPRYLVMIILLTFSVIL
ncbi:MAG: hypothetical protein H7837_12105 [Magnetococcus sp. MYC-9]